MLRGREPGDCLKRICMMNKHRCIAVQCDTLNKGPYEQMHGDSDIKTVEMCRGLCSNLFGTKFESLSTEGLREALVKFMIQLLKSFAAFLLCMDMIFSDAVLGSQLVKKSIEQMVNSRADEVVLEAEVTNTGALALYQNLGFIRDKRLNRLLLNLSTAHHL